MLHVKSIELSLCFTQGYCHLTHLQHLMWMERTNTQGLSSIDNILTQSQCQRGNTLLCLLLSYRVIVERTKHTRDVWIEMISILLTDNLL